jgi:hypothetical protein
VVGTRGGLKLSFFPILSAPGSSGVTTLYNFPPNNWEDASSKLRFVTLTWNQGGGWHSLTIDDLPLGAMRAYSRSDIPSAVPDDALSLLALSTHPFARISESLPKAILSNKLPNWRATLALKNNKTSVSYLGELDPFPAPGSLLTFAPFIQYGAEVENYMLFMNLEKNPQTRTASVEIYDCSYPERIKGKFEVFNNAISVISLDGLGFSPEDLPVAICKGMSGIPLYFSKTRDGEWMSLEHTHPPASSVVHGKRWEAQKLLKNVWISSLGMT